MLKANSVGGISYGSSVATAIPASNVLSKQASAMAEISDIIAATKTGLLNYRCSISNADTGGIVIKMIANAGNVAGSDGNVYQTVRIGNQVWTTENFRSTKYRDGTEIPFVTDSAAWNFRDRPGFCYYSYSTNTNVITKYGAYYNWYAVDTKKLAPAGWHVPSDAEWDSLKNSLIVNMYNWDGTTAGNKLAKTIAAKTDWNTNSEIGAIGNDLTRNNRSGFSALPGGICNFGGGFSGFGDAFSSWSTTMGVSSSFAYCQSFANGVASLDKVNIYKMSGFSIRLLKDN